MVGQGAAIVPEEDRTCLEIENQDGADVGSRLEDRQQKMVAGVPTHDEMNEDPQSLVMDVAEVSAVVKEYQLGYSSIDGFTDRKIANP